MLWLTIVEEERLQSGLEVSAVSPGPCCLGARPESSPVFCRGPGERPAAPPRSGWETSLLGADSTVSRRGE